MKRPKTQGGRTNFNLDRRAISSKERYTETDRRLAQNIGNKTHIITKVRPKGLVMRVKREPGSTYMIYTIANLRDGKW